MAVLVLIPLKKHWTVTDFTIKEWDMDSSQVNRLRKTKEGCKHLLSIFQ